MAAVQSAAFWRRTMRYSFRLAEVVGHMPDPRKRPGHIKNICEFTGLDRHQVAALLKNEVKYVPLDALSKLCAYLIERGYAKADELFFFQAEDGIRDWSVTGVQTCALPI